MPIKIERRSKGKGTFKAGVANQLVPLGCMPSLMSPCTGHGRGRVYTPFHGTIISPQRGTSSDVQGMIIAW